MLFSRVSSALACAWFIGSTLALPAPGDDGLTPRDVMPRGGGGHHHHGPGRGKGKNGPPKEPQEQPSYTQEELDFLTYCASYAGGDPACPGFHFDSN
ncbi:MAG: hypothetical protein M1832_001899 [Thelocarpon impressellum]|nr:MAG: hypothetical protein M1832_001899 [Thelocarpon impressellum]